MTIAKIHYNPGIPWKSVRLPGSKSIAARAMVCRYVQGLDTELANVPDCDDTREIQGALTLLDSRLHDPLPRLREFGELPPTSLRFDLGNGGTSLRFFVALCASLPGLEAEIDCAEGLKKRPLAPLIEELRRHDADITYLYREGYAPLLIRGRRLRTGPIEADGNISSQFISALLLASPLWEPERDHSLPAIPDNVVSMPYVEMTRKMMEQFSSRPERYTIETDWSAAGYFYELALAQPGRPLTIESLTDSNVSIQGDSLGQHMFGWLGVDTQRLDDNPHGAVALTGNADIIARNKQSGVPMTFDLRDTPDLAPALAAGMCMSELPFRLENLNHLRHKESDRLLTISTELGKAGYAVEATDGALIWTGRHYPVLDDETYESWGDHRIAMSMAILATRFGRLGIRGGEAVSKSFDDYYDQLRRVGFEIKL